MKLVSKIINLLLKYWYNWKENEFKSKLGYCGSNVSIYQPVCFEGKNKIFIEDNVSIAGFVHIWGEGGVEIGRNTLIASHVAITSLTHDKNADIYKQSLISKSVKIGENVWIGSHAVILPGITIGDNAIIGAGAIVTKNVLPNTIVTGVPAKQKFD